MLLEVDALLHAKELERGLLGRLLVSTEGCLEVTRRLRPNHFVDARHRVVFTGIRELEKEGRPHDLLSVVNLLRNQDRLAAAGREAYLAGIIDHAGVPSHLDYYVDVILDAARRRTVLHQIEDIGKTVRSSSDPYSVSRVRQLVGRLQRTVNYDVRGNTPAGQTRWKHTELLQTELAPLKWVVEDLVPDGGLTLLAGKKKVGKSWMALQIAQAVAVGTTVLDRPTSQGPVVYICLEDGHRRLRERLKKQSAPDDLPIEYLTRFAQLDQNGLDDLRTLLASSRPRLVIIDTLAAAVSGNVDQDSAGPMSDLCNALRAMGQDHGVGVMVIAHHGKRVRSDPGDDIRGSSAIAAAADINLGIYKKDGTYTLMTEGRDIGGEELRIAFDANETWSWHLVGDARKLAQSEAESEIIDALEVLGTADARALADAVGKTRPAVQKALKRLREQRRIAWKKEKGSNNKIIYGPWPKSDEDEEQ